MQPTIKRIMRALSAAPTVAADAKVVLPAGDGFYAWWIKPGSLPAVPSRSHPSASWDLLYIGIAPGRAGSAATLRSRISTNHIGGNTGSSTFKLTLASLLFEQAGWQPVRTATKVALNRDDNLALRKWQEENAAFTWVEASDPWNGSLEREVIAAMQPPLNLAENSAHPFHPTLTAARKRFRAAAR